MNAVLLLTMLLIMYSVVDSELSSSMQLSTKCWPLICISSVFEEDLDKVLNE